MKGCGEKKILWGSLSPDRRFWSEGARPLLFTSRPIRLKKAWAFDGLRTASAMSTTSGRAACGQHMSRGARAPSGGRGGRPGGEGAPPSDRQGRQGPDTRPAPSSPSPPPGAPRPPAPRSRFLAPTSWLHAGVPSSVVNQLRPLTGGPAL